MTAAPSSSSERRTEPRLFDRFSLGMYSAFLLWNWLLYAFGPAVQLLGKDLDFSAAAVGGHGIALAVGTALAGVALPGVVGAIGRRGALLLGGSLVAGGAVGLAGLGGLAGTLAATLVLSLGGNLAIAAAQAGLVVHHTLQGPTSVATANGVGTSIGLFGPLLIGASVAAGWGWRPIVLLTVPLAAAVAISWIRMPRAPALTEPRQRGRTPVAVPAYTPHDAGGPSARPDRGRNPLSRAGWWFLLAALTGVAVENATTFFALTLVVERTGAGPGLAAAAGAAFIAGMALSRLGARWITLGRRPSSVVLGGFVVTAAGWLVLWLSTAPAVAVAGLALSGIGCGLLYPISASLLLGTARGGTDTAQGLIMVAIGVAVGVVPFVLGLLTDAVGVHRAFLLVPLLVALGMIAAQRGAKGLART